VKKAATVHWYKNTALSWPSFHPARRINLQKMLATIRQNWKAHFIPLGFTALAIVMFILTPFWAREWYFTPFSGFLIEPNNILSQIGGENWPGKVQGLQWADRLLAINSQPVENSDQMYAMLSENGWQDFEATFYRRSDDSTFTVTISPGQVNFQDFLSLFIIPYLVGLTSLGIGLWAYRLRPDFRPTRAFVIFVSAVALLTATFLDMNTTHRVVLLWALSLPAAGSALLYLALMFPQELPVIQRWPFLRLIPFAIGLILAIFIARDILLPPDPYAYIDSWRWGYIFIALGILSFLVSLAGRVFGESSPFVRQQSRVIIFGAALAFLPILVLYLLPIGFLDSVPEFRPELLFPPIILLPLSVTYAILRYRLLDVDRLLSRALTYVLTTSAALLFYFLLLNLASFIFRQTVQSDDPFVIAAYILILVIAFAPLRNLIQRGIDRIFYRSQADYRSSLTNISKNLVVTPDIRHTINLLQTELDRALSPEKFVVFLFEDDRQRYIPFATQSTTAQVFDPEDPLPRLLSQFTQPLWLPPERPLPPELRGQEGLTKYRVFVPLRYEGRLIGFMALGQRRSGEPYDSDDFEFLSAVAAQSALALENARLFQNLRHTLEETMEMKNLMDNIFASVATGIITTDVEQKITLFNTAAERIFGLPLKKAIGIPLVKALPGLPLENIADNVLQNGETTQGQELNPKLASRGEVFLRVSASPLKDAHQATKGTTIVFEDLTENRKLEQERAIIHQTFGRVVAPRVRDRLLSNPAGLDLGGARTLVTVLFADLAGFTTFSESHIPEDVFAVLNTYLDTAAQAILEEEGTLDKFMGDAVMAMWNSPDPQPDHALRACRAALQLVERTRQLHERYSNLEYHRIFRVGITTGYAMVGNVGTSNLFNYTVIGDTVNLAQRLEVSAQPGQIFIQKGTYDIVKSQVEATPIEPLIVKGRVHPVESYLLKGLR
jgi:PAS domain S-box-containing protein